MTTGIKKAIDMTGSQAKLAALLGVSSVLVHRWVHRGYVSQPASLRIEEELGIPRRETLDPKLVKLVLGE